MDLSIIIVSWRVKALLEKCLASIFDQNFSNFEVWVIDNASGDGSAEMVREKFPQVNLIANQKNLGFARACNQAIKKARGGFILLLNPDTELCGGALSAMVNFMKNHEKCGVAGGKILNPDGSLQPSVRGFPSTYAMVITLLKLHNFFPWLVARYLALGFDYEKVAAVDQIIGAFFMIRRQLIDEIGSLDNRFFIWFEEVDFCRRAKRAGWQVLYYPQQVARHQQAKSFGQLSPLKRQWMFNRSLLSYFRKHHSLVSFLILLLLQPVSLFLASLVTIVNKI